MIKDVIALIEFIEKMTRRKEKLQRQLIEDYVEPAFYLFERVHENYLTTFRNYQCKINSRNPIELSLIIREIENDRLFSQSLIDGLSSCLSVENESLYDFVDKISEYLKSPRTLFSQSIHPWSNVRRDSLIEVLGWIDQSTPEIIASTGLTNDIQKFIRNQGSRRELSGQREIDLVSSLELAMRNFEIEASPNNTNENDLADTSKKIDQIKKYLATECIYFIVKNTQDNYRLVVKSYWRIKLGIVGD